MGAMRSRRRASVALRAAALLASLLGAAGGNVTCPVPAACEAGNFAPAGSDRCEPCPSGHVSAAGAEQCSPCPPGSYAASGLVCIPCDTGTYQAAWAQSACRACPERSEHRLQLSDGSYDNDGATGATSIDACVCVDGYVKVAAGDAWSCERCREGMVCTAAGVELASVPVRPGYWRASARSSDVRACPRAEDCSGGRSGAYCAEGAGGPLCATCDSGWTRSPSGACVPCASVSRYFAGSLVAAALLLVAGTLIGVRLLSDSAIAGRIERAAQQLLWLRAGLYRASVHFRSLYAFVQVVAALDLTTDLLAAYPFAAALFRSLRLVNLDLLEVFSAGCAEVGLRARFVALCLLPAAALVPTAAYLVVEALLAKRRALRLSRDSSNNAADRRKARRSRRSLASAGLLLARTMLYCAYAVVPSIMGMAFRSFDCVVVDTSAPDPTAVQYLRHELGVPCATTQSSAWLLMLGGAIVVYGFLVPAALARALAPRSGVGLTLLSLGYKPTFVWFEVAETVRKGLIVGLSVVARTRAVGPFAETGLAAGRETQLLFAFTVQAVHTFLFSQVSPLNSPEAMAVATGVHTVLSLLLVLLALLAAAGSVGGAAAGSGAVAAGVRAIARARTLNAFGVALTAGACVAAYALVMQRAAVEAARAKKEPLIMITDPGEDLDAEMALLLAKWMQEEGLIDLKAVIANLHPARTRARLVRGVLDALRLQHVPVGVGTDGGTTATADTFSESASHFICPPNSARAAALEPARALLHRTLSAARDRSVTLLCISSLKDAALFLRDNGELCAAKLKRVVVMGGVDADWYSAAEASAAWLRPDNARNHRFDVGAAHYFYSACQHAGIPMTIVTRHAACAAPVPRETYDFLAQSGSPIGWRLRKAQRDSIELLWRRACAPPASALRGDLPERCSREWFINTFCVGDVGERNGDDTIWDLIASFQLYDSTALVAAVPALSNYLLTPTAVRVAGVEHHLVGESADEPGVRSARDLSSFMLTAIADAIGVQSASEATSHVIVVLLDSPTVSAVPALLLLRALLDLNLLQCDSLLLVRARDGGLAPSTAAARCAEQLGLTALTEMVVVDDDSSFVGSNIRTSAVFSSSIRTRVDNGAPRDRALDAVDALAAVYDSVGVRARLVLGGGIPMSLARFSREEALLFREKTESIVALGEVVSGSWESFARSKAGADAPSRAYAGRRMRQRFHGGFSSSLPEGDDSATSRHGSKEGADSADESGDEKGGGEGPPPLFPILPAAAAEDDLERGPAAAPTPPDSPPFGLGDVRGRLLWRMRGGTPPGVSRAEAKVAPWNGAGGVGERGARLSFPGASPTRPSKPAAAAADGADQLRPRLRQPRTLGATEAMEQAADALTSQCMQFGVPMRLVTQDAADACALPAALFDELATHAGELGALSRKAVRGAATALWRAAQCAPSDPARGKLPAECDADWFEQTYCAGARADAAEDVWRLASTIPFPAGATLVSACTKLGTHYLREAATVVVKAARHTTVEPTDVAAPPTHRVFVAEMLAKAAMHDLSHFGAAPAETSGRAPADDGAPAEEPLADAGGAERADGARSRVSPKVSRPGTPPQPSASDAGTPAQPSASDAAWDAGARGVGAVAGRRRRALPPSLTFTVEGLGPIRVSDALPDFLTGARSAAGSSRTGWRGALPLVFSPAGLTMGLGTPARRGELANIGAADTPPRPARRSARVSMRMSTAEMTGGGRSSTADAQADTSRGGTRRGGSSGRQKIEMRDVELVESSRERFERVRAAAHANSAPPRDAKRERAGESRVVAIDGYVRMEKLSTMSRRSRPARDVGCRGPEEGGAAEGAADEGSAPTPALGGSASGSAGTTPDVGQRFMRGRLRLMSSAAGDLKASPHTRSRFAGDKRGSPLTLPRQQDRPSPQTGARQKDAHSSLTRSRLGSMAVLPFSGGGSAGAGTGGTAAAGDGAAEAGASSMSTPASSFGGRPRAELSGAASVASIEENGEPRRNPPSKRESPATIPRHLRGGSP